MEKSSNWQKLYESLARRVEALDRENAALKMQLLMSEVQGKAWETDKGNQQAIIQQELTKLNVKCQEQSEEIVQLRVALKKYKCAGSEGV